MADVQEQKQPQAVSALQHYDLSDAAASTTLPSPLPPSSTPQIDGHACLPALPDLDHQSQTGVDSSALQPFQITDADPQDWSAEQYVPTESDLAAALGEAPLDVTTSVDELSNKPELDGLSPSTVLPKEEVTQLSDVLEPTTSVLGATPHIDITGAEFENKTDAVTVSCPETTTSVPIEHTTLPEDASLPPEAPASIAESSEKAVVVTSTGEVKQRTDDDSSADTPGEMASYHYPPEDRHPHADYSTTSTYGTSNLHQAQYGYHTDASHEINGYSPVTNPSRTTGMSLPSMRTFDSVSSHLQTQQHRVPRQPSLPMPTANGMSPTGSLPYAQQSMPLTSNGPYDLHHDRYSLQGDAHSIFSTSRHKKEIKRRTKTGCLTCRKRRIKCDETHPTCKNCQKSKRECLGYDPIFKQQQQQPITNIQPAPNHSLGGATSTSAHNYSTSTTSASASSTPYLHYSSPSSTLSHTTTSATGYGHTTFHSAGSSSHFDNILATPARKMRVDELVNIEGHAPPTLDGPLTSEQLDECKDLYEQVYAPGLESFFEAKWYVMGPGYDALIADAGVNEVMMGFLQTVRNLDPHDGAGMQYSASLEFRVVWDLARLVHRADSKPHTGPGLPAIEDAHDVKNRVAILDVLLAGEFLEHNPLKLPPSDADYHRVREFRFWFYLGEFLRIKKPETPNMTAQKTHAMSMLRELLDGRENRDVLYSLAIIRDLAPKFPPDFENSLPPHLDETDPKSKLAVARKFIQDESQVSGGTTNVVRRIAELGVRAFILPGGNIPR